MNYLGHSLLSINDSDEKFFGNFAGDFYKGIVKTIDVSDEIKKGIELHRKIDSLTDYNNKMVDILDDKFGLHKGILVDIFMDHFIAIHWETLSKSNLEHDIEKFYKKLDNFEHLYPKGFDRLYFWLKKEDWFLQYKTIDGIDRTLHGMSSRVREGGILKEGIFELESKYKEIEELTLYFVKWIHNELHKK